MNRIFLKKDDPLYKYTIHFMEESWGTKGKGIFPGCQPISIERKHFGILSNNDYVVCEKTDGDAIHDDCHTSWKPKDLCIYKQSA